MSIKKQTQKAIIEEIERLMQTEDTLQRIAETCKETTTEPSDKLMWLGEINKHIHTWNVLEDLKSKIMHSK